MECVFVNQVLTELTVSVLSVQSILTLIHTLNNALALMDFTLLMDHARHVLKVNTSIIIPTNVNVQLVST